MSELDDDNEKSPEAIEPDAADLPVTPPAFGLTPLQSDLSKHIQKLRGTQPSKPV